MTPGDFAGNYIHYGVREHAMAAAMNGMTLHGGIVPYAGTFLVFSDYCRPSIRLSALMGQRVVYVMTHDSIGLGEDGPTHQPIEHIDSLRIIPGLNVFRPADGIETAMAIRREHPRLPVLFYSIQDDDAYYRAFRQAGILSHYAYVRKSNFLLPQMLLPLLRDAVNGRSYIDPDIESRVQEVRHKDENAPLDLLEPNERQVALMLAQGMSNQQIAQRMGFRDKRTISRVNGQIYAAWNLNRTAGDEKVARTRAVIIINHGEIIAEDLPADHYILTGGMTHPVKSIARGRGLGAEKIHDLGGKSAEDVFRKVVELTPEHAIVVGVGNIGGAGGQILSLFRERSKRE